MNIESSYSELRNGSTPVGTTPVTLTDSDLRVYGHVTIKADPDNSGTVYVGDAANVGDGNGYPLAGGESVDIPIDNARKIWLVGSDADQLVKWIAT